MEKTKSNSLRKLLLIGGGVVTSLLAILIALPFFVNVDQYRPDLLKVANEKLNGSLECGELQLSVWGTLKVKIAGLKISDAKKSSILSVKESYVQIPWTSVLGGTPLLTFVMNEPQIQILKSADGKLNIMTLMKESETKKETPSVSTSKEPVSPTKLPNFVTQARIGVNISKAKLLYKDDVKKSETELKDLDIKVKDFSLSQKTEIEVGGQFESSEEKLFKIKGPFKIEANGDPTVVNGELKKAMFSVNGNFSDLEISAGNSFYKKKGIPATLSGKFELTPEDLTIDSIAAEFFNIKLNGKGKVTELKNTTTGPVTQFSLSSNRIELSAWNELIPMLKDFSLSGTGGLGLEVFGPSSQIQYKADVDVKDFKAKNAMLKSEPVLNFGAKITTDKLERIFLTMNAPGNDLNVEGSILSFSEPKIDLNIKSTHLDLDQLIEFPKPKENVASDDTKKEDVKKGTDGAKKEDFDALLDPLRKNEVLLKTTMLAKIDLKFLKAYDVKMTDLNSKWLMKDLNLSMESLGMKIFEGSIQSKANMNLKPKAPTYGFSMAVTNLDLKSAVESQMKLFKDTIIGKLTFKMDGNGSSFNPESAKANLNSKGSVRVDKATFQAIDIGKMASEAINGALDKVGDKIPGLKGKKIKGLENGASKYETIMSDFTINRGQFSAPNFIGKAMLNQGIDVKGSTQVGLLDKELKADWELIDTYNLLKGNEISAELAGVKIDHILTEKGQPVVIPVSVGCKYVSPCASYGKVPEHFLKIALNNAKSGATEKIKSEVQNKAKDAAKEVGKKLLKGLFGN